MLVSGWDWSTVPVCGVWAGTTETPHYFVRGTGEPSLRSSGFVDINFRTVTYKGKEQ